MGKALTLAMLRPQLEPLLVEGSQKLTWEDAEAVSSSLPMRLLTQDKGVAQLEAIVDEVGRLCKEGKRGARRSTGAEQKVRTAATLSASKGVASGILEDAQAGTPAAAAAAEDEDDEEAKKKGGDDELNSEQQQQPGLLAGESEA